MKMVTCGLAPALALVGWIVVGALPGQAAPAHAAAHKTHKAVAAKPAPTDPTSPDADITSDQTDPATDTAAAVPTGPIPDLRATLVGDYAAADDAFSAKNTDVLLQPYDAAFQNVDQHGTSTSLADVQTELAELLDNAKSAASATRILSVSPSGKLAANVDVKQHIVMMYVDPQSGDNSRVTIDNVCRDTWQLSGSDWMKTRSKLVSSARRVDGVQPSLPISHW